MGFVQWFPRTTTVGGSEGLLTLPLLFIGHEFVLGLPLSGLTTQRRERETIGGVSASEHVYFTRKAAARVMIPVEHGDVILNILLRMAT